MRQILSTRLLRSAKVTSAHWQRRALFLVGGITVGAAAVGLALAADWVQTEFAHLVARWRYASLIVTPLGFALSVYLTNRFFQNSQGSGIPQAIAARELDDQDARGRLVSIRIAIGKILLTLLGLLCGASAGREGPTVQVGASIIFAIGRFSPRRQPGLILAGAAAGVAAAFNTPLAGIVFGIEEMSRAFETRTSGLIIAAVIAAGLTSLALVGSYAYFGSSPAMLRNGLGWLAVPLCGIAAGDTIYGTGYAQVKAALEGGTPLRGDFGLFKFLATTFSTISGIPGGIFSPSLAVGAGLGANIAHLFPTAPVAPIILLGMVSYFAGVVQAPITAFVIVTEMTDNHAMVVPLMTAALIAHATSRLICTEGV